MKKVWNVLALVGLVVAFTNCSGCCDKGPAAIEKSIYKELQKGDYHQAAELLVSNLDTSEESTAEEKEQTIQLFAEKAQSSMEAKGGIKSFEITEEAISEDGLSAVVSTKVVYGDNTEKVEQTKYVNKDGVWKMSLNK